MVLRRQTGTEEKLGSPSLRHQALPSPLHPYSSPALFHIFPFSFPISLFLPLAALVISFSPSHFLFSPHSFLLSPVLTPPSCLFLQIVAYLNRSCSVLSHHRTESKQCSPPTASSVSYGGRQSPALRLHWGRRVRLQP